MSTQMMMSDLFVDLSTEQQQLLAGGQDELGDDEFGGDEFGDDESGGDELSLSGSPVRHRPRRYLIRGVVSLRSIPRSS
ncbi:MULTISPECIES: hypothetical protein [Nostoc]|uniref:Uncharacterized protein n=2 Tax=Nostoc TaxID=1177 RepID=A0ABR8I4R7_9NOSO|nr:MULTISPECIES: hypothetical protein [Nostoc]MBD2560242.1 hypothetical protein [Nostoc linckia FACHB-391]MBD2645897.1 hypothetical protein [Nostoc foliaceum FACHB-393]